MDLNNFVISGLGADFFIDSGYGSGPKEAGSCSRSEAPNCILVAGPVPLSIEVGWGFVSVVTFLPPP